MTRQMIETMLDAPVSQYMGRDVATIRVDFNVQQALSFIREHPPAGRVIYFYVVDAGGHLQGVVPTRRLLLNALDTPIADIMVRDVVAIPESATVLEACEFFTLHRLLAFPVVNAERKIVGLVDLELYTEEMGEIEEASRGQDLFQLVGVHLAESQQGQPLVAFCSRFPWLLCNVVGGILAAFLSGMFEAELQQVVALALFIPVVLALAESVSIQSVSLTLEVLHGQSPTYRTLLTKLRKELVTGLLLGLASALLVALVAGVWLRDGRLMLCLLLGITVGVTCSAMFGVAMPNLLRLLRRDPQVAAGPIALALSDMFTLLCYFNLARHLL